MTESRPTVGIIGLGYGRAHIPAFQARGCRVVAVCQRDEAAARKVADRYSLVGRFLEAIKTGQTPSPSLEDGMRAQAVLDAALEAAASGGWVAVA